MTQARACEKEGITIINQIQVSIALRKSCGLLFRPAKNGEHPMQVTEQADRILIRSMTGKVFDWFLALLSPASGEATSPQLVLSGSVDPFGKSGKVSRECRCFVLHEARRALLEWRQTLPGGLPLAADKLEANHSVCATLLVIEALRQSKAIRADLDAFSSSSTSSADPALQGQLTTTIASFSRTLDDYQRNIDTELVATKAEQGRDRIANFRSDLLDFRSRFAELKHEREAAQHASNRNDLLGRRAHVSGTPENPYADTAATSSGAGRGENVNPLFRTSNPNFTPGASGQNSYSAYQSPYGLGQDQARETHALREQNFFSSTNQTLDEYLERGRTVLSDLGDQREMLKNTQMKLYNIGNTLGISGDTIRMVERRAKQDKWIFWGGVAGFIVFVYLVLRFLR
nr:protein transport protein bos1 [Quercus suber]POE94756.1 protein transport protein bos1 [Quercus suber]